MIVLTKETLMKAELKKIDMIKRTVRTIEFDEMEKIIFLAFDKMIMRKHKLMKESIKDVT